MREVFTKTDGNRFGRVGAQQIEKLKEGGFEITVVDRNDGLFIQAVRFKVPDIATYVLVEFSNTCLPKIQYTVTQELCFSFPRGLGVLVEKYELFSSEKDLPKGWFEFKKREPVVEE